MTRRQTAAQLAQLRHLDDTAVHLAVKHGERLRYDYHRQCWTLGGIVQDCAHPEAMHCGCYARAHAGEHINV